MNAELERKVEDRTRELDTLLREVHHRIKNNMYSVHSILSMQMKEKSVDDGKALSDAAGRIFNMMVLYDKLYRAEDFSKIPADSYLPAIIGEIVSNFPIGKKVNLEMSIGDFTFGSKKIQPVVIIMNELITNILKYAFSDQEHPRISVTASRRDDTIVVELADNGSGYEPSAGKKEEGFGVTLVNILSRQIGGEIIYARDRGTVTTLTFPA
jgi:two-component sensor histidine kinase